MRDLIATALILASVAWLIPYPGLIWLSAVVWVIAWFALPATEKRSPKGPRSNRTETERSDLRP